MKTWQKEPNSVHYTREKLFCTVCGKQEMICLEIRQEKYRDLSCWSCLEETMEKFYYEYDYEYINIRLLNDVQFDKRKEQKKKNRSDMNYKLRYEILKRDKYKCVLCGKKAQDTQIEIDHIKPIVNGGNNNKNNLRTLCFECNRGKGKDD